MPHLWTSPFNVRVRIWKGLLPFSTCTSTSLITHTVVGRALLTITAELAKEHQLQKIGTGFASTEISRKWCPSTHHLVWLRGYHTKTTKTQNSFVITWSSVLPTTWVFGSQVSQADIIYPTSFTRHLTTYSSVPGNPNPLRWAIP